MAGAAIAIGTYRKTVSIGLMPAWNPAATYDADPVATAPQNNVMMESETGTAAVRAGVSATAISGRHSRRLRPPGSACLYAAVVLMSALLQTPASAQNAGGDQARDASTQAPTTACVDPRVTIMLTDGALSHRHGARWRARQSRRGRCFAIQPGEHWERIYGVRGGLVIMRRTPPSPGVPPLYFRVGSLPNATRAPALGIASGTAPDADGSATPIQVEALPPLPPPAPRTAAGPPLAQAVRSRTPPRPVPLVSEESMAGERSYAIGFVIAIVLVILLLAAFVLLMHALLRRPPDAQQQPSPPDPADEPVLPPLAEANGGAAPTPVRLPPSDARAYGPAASDPDAVVCRSGLAPDGPDALQSAGLPSLAAWPTEDEADRRHCVMLLREAGWRASIQPLSGRRHVSVIAQRGGRLMVLHYLPKTVAVDEQAVEESCMAREREQADIAVIVSNVGYTAGIRQLATRIGVDLLHEDELHAFAA